MNEDINIDELADFVDIPEEYHGLALEERMPSLVEDWTKALVSVSKKNYVPATSCFFVILGQIVKDFVRIPRGENTEDSRIHFCWMQTSGSGKSTLWNFFGKVNEEVNQKINLFEGTNIIEEPNVYIQNRYDLFDIVDYTDAALIGFYEKVDNPELADFMSLSYEDRAETVQPEKYIFERRSGALEGNGLAHWDEFEYSGIFKQSQHKENSVVYMNTFMNTLEGDAWVITKKLKEGHIMECQCQRSVWATTYIPRHLQKVITNNGVLQRMLIYVREVPEEEIDEMNLETIALSGKRINTEKDISKFSNALFRLYTDIKAEFIQNGSDPFSTIKYSDGFAEALVNEYKKMRDYIKTCHPEIRKVVRTFITRMNVQLLKLSVLCCIANSPKVKDPTKKFLVTPTHVRQAYILTQQCYITLVEWLEQSLQVKKSVLVQNKSGIFVEKYREMLEEGEGENEFISKPKLFDRVQQAGVSRAQCYRDWKLAEKKFELDTKGRSVFVKLKGEKKK